MDQMVEMLTKYSKNLEETVKKRTNQLEEEKRKLDNLIHQMLPVSVAKQLIQEDCNTFLTIFQTYNVLKKIKTKGFQRCYEEN